MNTEELESATDALHLVGGMISTAYLNAAKAASFHDAAVANLVNLADSLACDTEGLVLSVVVGALVRLG